MQNLPDKRNLHVNPASGARSTPGSPSSRTRPAKTARARNVGAGPDTRSHGEHNSAGPAPGHRRASRRGQSCRQVLRAGVSRNAIVSKVNQGLWQQLHPGVYGAFTGALSREVRLWAAVLYAGPGALLSHETAAEVLGLADRMCPVIHVTIPATRRSGRRTASPIHHSSFDYPRWRPQRGIPPHTFYPETIVDLAAAADNLDAVVAWVSRGIARHLVSEAQLRTAFAVRSRLRWRDEIDEVIERVAGGSHFPLEFRYDRDVERAHGLPAAERQAKFLKRDGTRGFRDRCYQQYGLIVELDGKEFHPSSTTGRTGPVTTRPQPRRVRPFATAGPTSPPLPATPLARSTARCALAGTWAASGPARRPAARSWPHNLPA